MSSGGNSKRITVPRNKTFFEKQNYKFTLNPAIDYALCCVQWVSFFINNLTYVFLKVYLPIGGGTRCLVACSYEYVNLTSVGSEYILPRN